MKKLQQKLFNQQDLNQQEAQSVFNQVVQGKLSDVEICSLLVSLKIKTECPEEIAGAALALREHAITFPPCDYPISDSCGTGGSGMNSVNISTMAAIVLAELGVAMVKHGNRSVSSKCGSADVLEKLGVVLTLSPQQAKQCLDQVNFCFLFAPSYHPGVKHVMPVRNQLQTRTIFNLLGPLINPAKPDYQLMGVYSEDRCLAAAKTLKLAQCKAAMVVHSGGYDEITLHSPTKVVELKGGELASYTLSNQDFDFPRCDQQAITGDDPIENAKLFQQVLSGKLDTSKKISIAHTVAANAAALLKLSNKAPSLKQGAQQALNVIAEGQAMKRLNSIVELSQKLANNQPRFSENNND